MCAKLSHFSLGLHVNAAPLSKGERATNLTARADKGGHIDVKIQVLFKIQGMIAKTKV